nr:cytochrome P450 [Tanacetum cinerariifolium]
MVPLGDKVANLVPYCPLWGSNKGFHPRGILVFNHRKSRLPPGPYPLPIIENLLELRNKPHLSLTTLSKRYGPLMSLKLGSITTIVVSSPKMAKEFFQIHDQLFSGRSVPMSTQVVNHSKHSMVFLPAGDKWRRLRRITKEYLFSAQCVDRSENLRKKKVQELLQHVTQCCTNNKAVNVGEVAFTTVLNMISNLFFSRDFSQYDTKVSQEYRDIITRASEVNGKPNLVDFFLLPKPLDPQGLTREATIFANKLYDLFDKIVVNGKPNLVDFFLLPKPLDPQGLTREATIFANKLYDLFDKIVFLRLQKKGVHQPAMTFHQQKTTFLTRCSDMTTKFDKLVKFEGQDFRRWQKKMHFLLTTLKVVYVLSTPSPEWHEDETLETTRKRMKWENDDNICRGHILNGMSDSLFYIYQNIGSAKELWESLESKYMAEDATSKKFLVSNFMNYKMVDTRPVMELFHEMLRILGQCVQHNLMMDEAISVAVIID